MLQRLLLIASLLLLAACQSIPVDNDYNPTFDFSRPYSWQWRQPAIVYRPLLPGQSGSLEEQRILGAVTSGLEQRGLRQAANGQSADLQVQVQQMTRQQQQYVTNYMGGEVIPMGRGGYWTTPVYAQTQAYTTVTSLLQIDLFDRNGQLVWRARTAQNAADGSDPLQRGSAILKTVERLLQNYPPRR